MRIAYVFLIHTNPEQFKRLFKATYHSQNYYVVHIDKKSELALHNEVKEFLSSYPNALVLKSHQCNWGGFSIVNAQLRGIKKALGMGDWDFVVNLSGQDFPLMDQKSIMEFLDGHRNYNFLNLIDQPKEWPESMHRIDRYYFEFRGKVHETKFKRPFLKGVKPYAGSQWFILNRKFCEYLFASAKSRRIIRFYRNTIVPDEAVFQTVIMNSPFRDTVITDYKRVVIWDRATSRPIIFKSGDFDRLVMSKSFFARKFDKAIDDKILDMLEEHIATLSKRICTKDGGQSSITNI